MPDEFIIVSFPESRTVLSGGNDVGPTNQELVINAGTHTFTLTGPEDFNPPSQQVTVQGTSVVTPMLIEFTQSTPSSKPIPPTTASECPV